MPVDRFANSESSLSDPSSDAAAVAKSDSAAMFARSLYIGGAGDVVVETRAGSVVTFAAVPAGTILPIRCVKVRAATTATNIVAFI